MNSVAQRRKSSNLTQSEFAQKCGISRQFLGLVETGKTQPNVQVALHMAKMLGCTVEALFEPQYDADTPIAFLPLDEKPIPFGTRVALGNVRGQWIAKPVDSELSMALGFSSADGVVRRNQEQPSVSFFESPEAAAKNIIISGCDPALNLMREHLITQDTRVIVHTCGSERSLDLFNQGKVHMAGFHFPEINGKGNLDHLSNVLERQNKAVFHFSSWELGWMLNPRIISEFRSIDDLAQPQLRLANREKGSGARVWLDEQLNHKSIPGSVINGYEVEYATHFACAQAVKSGVADIALGPCAVAETMGLAFIPATEFPFDLVIHMELLEQPAIIRFLEELNTNRLQQQMKHLAGYNTSGSGSRLL